MFWEQISTYLTIFSNATEDVKGAERRDQSHSTLLCNCLFQRLEVNWIFPSSWLCASIPHLYKPGIWTRCFWRSGPDAILYNCQPVKQSIWDQTSLNFSTEFSLFLRQSFTNAVHTCTAPGAGSALSDDKECGSIVTNDCSFRPEVRKRGTEKAVSFILWAPKERLFSNFLFQISYT